MRYLDLSFLRVMVLALGFCLLGSHVQAQTYGALYASPSEVMKVQISKGMALDQALEKLEQKFNVVFLYRTDAVQNKEAGTTYIVPNDVEEALTLLLEEQELNFKYLNPKTYGIYSVKGKPVDTKASIFQQVRGVVTDAENGETLPGVNVSIKGTTRGTATNLDGKYELTAPSASDTLVFSFIGYETRVVPINGRSVVNVSLVTQAIVGDELVVVGYGEQRKSDVTGSIGQVSSTTIENKPVADVTEALQGATANLTIQQPSGEPGSGMHINIRGISTMNNNDPLVVIDGVVGGDLSNVNPKNIESISVLKDAGSAAIYGSRAANGVILVTTKSGQKNMEPTVTFSSQTGINAPNILYEPVKGYENAILRNQAQVNSGNSPIYTPEEIRTIQEEGDIEWFMDSIFQNALQQDYNLAVAGGNENTTYRVSTRYFDQENNFVGDYGLRRYNIRMNLETEYDKFDVESKLSYQRSDITNHTSDTGFLIADAKRTPPYYNYSMKDGNGRYLLNDVLTEFNPLGQLEEGGTHEATNDVFTGVLQVEYEIVEGLEAQANFSAVINSNESLTQVKQVEYYSSPTATEYANISGSDRNTNNDNYRAITINPRFILNYQGVVEQNHRIDALLGVANESFTGQSNGIHLIFTDPDLNIPTSETEIQNSSYTTLETRSQNSLNSAFGRAKYSYDDKYYFEFNFRYDGSSRFAEENRWGFFPSVSLAWNMANEDFMEGYRNNVGDFKLRASYGSLGNQSVEDYQYQTSYFTFSNAYAFNNGTVSGTGFEFANEDIRWEQTTTLNLGLDASAFNNRLTLSLDAYEKVTSDILLTPTVPGTYGGAVPDFNAGEMRNRGWEVSLNYNTAGSVINHTFGINLADSWNEVVSFTGDEEINSADQMQRIIREGVAFNSYYGYKTDGFFQNQQEITEGPLPIGTTVQPGDVRYKDKNGDGIIDDEDRYILGNAFPRYTFGLQYGLNWKNFDLNLFVQGVGQRTMFLRGENVEPYHANYAYTMYEHQKDFWTPTNTDARWPRLSAPGSSSNTNNYQMSSDLYAFDASYIRLKNVKVGYTVPKSVSLGAKSIYVYVTAKNLFTLSKMDFYNPESTEFNNDMSNSGANSGRSYPEIRYFGFGIELSI